MIKVPGDVKIGKPKTVSNKGTRTRTRIGLVGNRKPIVPIKKDDMGRSGLKKGGRAIYNKGGYASVQDMEKACMSKTGYNTMKIKGEK